MEKLICYEISKLHSQVVTYAGTEAVELLTKRLSIGLSLRETI